MIDKLLLLFPDGNCHEKNFSTQYPEAQAQSWFSRAHEHQERPSRAEGAPRQRPRPAERLIRALISVGTGSFTRRARLTKPVEFQRIFRENVRSSNGFLTVLAAPNDLGYPRLGLAISRRFAKTAVDRNHIKRMIRESFRLNQERLGSIDIVVLARDGVDRLSSHELRTALERHWMNLVGRCKSS